MRVCSCTHICKIHSFCFILSAHLLLRYFQGGSRVQTSMCTPSFHYVVIFLHRQHVENVCAGILSLHGTFSKSFLFVVTNGKSPEYSGIFRNKTRNIPEYSGINPGINPGIGFDQNRNISPPCSLCLKLNRLQELLGQN